MKLKQFIYGTQYYRAPTPLPDEWEDDISKFESLGLNTFQIRTQWRRNEPSEGNYRFDDIDRLFELSRKHKRQVIFKFLLENAPQYIFDKYDGERRGFDGYPIRAGSNGSFYVGGWMPCFENPEVRKAATCFIEECVKRYKNCNELILWNAWNEPRSRPVSDCACKHSMKEYQSWLKSKYRTIEHFNNFFGVSEESFDTFPVPGMPQGYWDLFLFRKWRSTDMLQERVKWVYDTIRKFDATRPIMSHVGGSSCLQGEFNDNSDDFSVAKSVDFYGTSYPVQNTLKTHKDEILCGLIPDYLRHIDKNFFVHELYPDWGDWTEPVSVEDLRYKIWTIISRAAKGILFWQYRAERLGNENNVAGLVGMDGRFNVRSDEAGYIGRLIEVNQELFQKLSVEHADVALLYDSNSALISQIEDVSPHLWDFSTRENAVNNFNLTHRGMYELFFDISIPVDYLDTRELKDLNNYKVLYLPYMTMIQSDIVGKLEEFVREGGVLLVDEGFGLRQQNTWLHPSSPDSSLQLLTPARWIERVRCDGTEKIMLSSGEVSAMPMRTVYDASEGSVMAQYSTNSQPAIREFTLGKGRIVLFGSSIGYSYAKHGERAWAEWLVKYLDDVKLRRNPCDDIEKGIYSRALVAGNEKIIIIFNRSKNEQIVDFPFSSHIRELTGQVILDNTNEKVILPAGHVACLVSEM